MAKSVDVAWIVLSRALEAAIQKPLSPEQALEVLDKIEEWTEATRDALRDDIKRAAAEP